MGPITLSDQDKQKQIASVALVNVWFENETNRFQRVSHIDPWKTYDNFRINHTNKRDVKVSETIKDQDDQEHRIKVEYLSENKFNVYTDKDEIGY